MSTLVRESQSQIFLNTLESSGSFVFQTFDDNEARKKARAQKHKEELTTLKTKRDSGELSEDDFKSQATALKSKYKDKFSRILSGTLEEHFEALVKLNESGAGVFVTVNHSATGGRAKGDIDRIRAYFVEIDDTEAQTRDASHLEALQRIAQLYPLAPSITVKTSKGAHAYWLIKDAPLDMFEETQSKYIDLLGSDSKIRDISRVLRLPQPFVHAKNEYNPLLVELTSHQPENVYTHQQITQALDEALATHGKWGAVEESKDTAEPVVYKETIETSPAASQQLSGHNLKYLRKIFLDNKLDEDEQLLSRVLDSHFSMSSLTGGEAFECNISEHSSVDSGRILVGSDSKARYVCLGDGCSSKGFNNKGSWGVKDLLVLDGGLTEEEAIIELFRLSGVVIPEPDYKRSQQSPGSKTTENRITSQNNISSSAQAPKKSHHVSIPVPEITPDIELLVVHEAIAKNYGELLLNALNGTTLQLILNKDLKGDKLTQLRESGITCYMLMSSTQTEGLLTKSGIEHYVLKMPLVGITEDSKQTLNNLKVRVKKVLADAADGDKHYLAIDYLSESDDRMNRGEALYPSGLYGFDKTLNGGFYDGLHMIGGATGGGKTAFTLALAQLNAKEKRPVIIITYEQSKRELWNRLTSAATGLSLGAFRSGLVGEDALSARLSNSEPYQALINDVAPYLSVFEGNGIGDSQSWGVDRLTAHVKRVKAAHGIAPLVILDYLQRMPVDNKKNSDRRTQIDESVTALQVQLGRGEQCPVIAISSLSRGNYGELLTEPLERRLEVWKESGGIEYTAYTASLIYPLATPYAIQLGYTPQSPSDVLLGSEPYRLIVLDLVKNREGDVGYQWALKWYPRKGIYEELDTQPIDVSRFKG